MAQAQQKARTRRAQVQSASAHQLKQLFTQRLHFSDLLRRVNNATRSASLILACNFSVAGEHFGDFSSYVPTSLARQKVDVSILDPQISVVIPSRLEQASTYTVNNGIPLSSPGGQHIGAQAAPEAKSGGAQTHNSTVAVQPVKDAGDREIRHLIAWVAWIGLCLFGGFIAGTLSAPRRKSTEGETQNRQS